MRICGTPMALASAYCERCSGFKKSSRRTSPGWAGGKSATSQISSMIVDDLDIVGVGVTPAKANAPRVYRTASTPGQVVVAQGEVAITLAGDLENGIGDAGLQ